MRKPEYVASAYHELPGGGYDAIIRVELGFIVVVDDEGRATAYPPGNFVEDFPDFDVASLPRGIITETEFVEANAEPAPGDILEGAPFVEPPAGTPLTAEELAANGLAPVTDPVPEAAPVTEPEA